MSESVLIWGLALGFAVTIVLTYLLTQRRRGRFDEERLAEARHLGIDAPKGLYPYVDPKVCIGCGGCINACPEGDVLGLVGGLATVVNGMRCIGIGQCVQACPVDGVELRVGSVKGRADIPVMNASRETNVPGVFICGELGGLALIRNAVNQGKEAVDTIASGLENRNGDDPKFLDLVIIGAGPSGLSAALSAVENRLSYTVLEQEDDFGGTIFQYPRHKLTHTQPVDLPLYGRLKKAEYTKEELLKLFTGLVHQHNLNLKLGQRVTQINRSEEGFFHIRTTRGEFLSRRVLLALGRRGTPRKLGVNGESLPKVMYQVRDAAQYRQRQLLCVGGGDSAIEAAMGLARQAGNDVAISYRKKQFFRIKKRNQERLAKLVQRGKIKLMMESQVLDISEKAVRLQTPLGSVSLPNDYVFVLIGGIPPFKLLKESGILFRNEVS